jgi:Na+/H+-translocating membrane pyrophosphatase
VVTHLRSGTAHVISLVLLFGFVGLVCGATSASARTATPGGAAPMRSSPMGPGCGLAHTGVSMLGLALLGVGLLALGCVALALGRSRTQAPLDARLLPT